MADRIEKIEAALSKLEMSDNDRQRLGQIAQELNIRIPLTLINASNRGNTTRKKNGVKSELCEVAKSSAKLMDIIHNLHGDSLAAITKGDNQDPLWIWSDLEKLNNRCWDYIENQPDQPETKGPPKKQTHNAITDILAFRYHELTGKKPTVIVDTETENTRGPFLDFVKAIFVAFNVNASARSQAKAASERWTGDDKTIELGLSTLTLKLTNP